MKMKIVLLRVGIDSGCGGIQGPLFQNRSFEYIPIPEDEFEDEPIDAPTYGNTVGKHDKPLIEYFPLRQRNKMEKQPIHFDPEFKTFTYGDPSKLKSRLQYLESGDLLIFYCGLKGWCSESDPALYLLGYFDVSVAGKANDFSSQELQRSFGENFHVRYSSVLKKPKNDLVLVKGSQNSRLFNKAELISEMGKDRSGRPLKILSKEMQQKYFGDLNKKPCIQRSSPRWVDPDYHERAVNFVKFLE